LISTIGQQSPGLCSQIRAFRKVGKLYPPLVPFSSSVLIVHPEPAQSTNPGRLGWFSIQLLAERVEDRSTREILS
jgi:hypothetical protein